MSCKFLDTFLRNDQETQSKKALAFHMISEAYLPIKVNAS